MKGERIRKFDLRVLLTKEIAICHTESDPGWIVESAWVAECLEYDIGAQGKTIEQAKVAFAKTFASQIVVDLAYGRQPLEGIGQSPDDVWQRYESAEPLKEESFTLPKEAMPAFLADQLVRHELRVA